MPDSQTPANQSSLARYAMWSGAATVGVPALWAVLTNTLGGNAGLAVGWFGVLPVILLVPVGITVTLVLTIAAAVTANTPQKTADVSSMDTNNPHGGNT